MSLFVTPDYYFARHSLWAASVQFVLVELNNKKISNLKKLKTKFDGRRQTLTDAFENDILFHIHFQTKNNKWSPSKSQKKEKHFSG